MKQIVKTTIISLHKNLGLDAKQIAHELNLDEQAIRDIITLSKMDDFRIRTTNYGGR